MKKALIVLIIVAVLGGVGYVVYEKTMNKPVEVVDILPQGVFLYLRFDDVEENLRKLTAMPVWQGLSRINYDGILENGNVDPQQVMMFKMFRQQVTDVISNPMAKKLFGNEVALAFYPLADLNMAEMGNTANFMDPRFLEQVLSVFYIVTRVDADIQAAEFASRFFGQLGPDVSQEEVEYSGQKIRLVTVNGIGIRFGMVRINDLIVIGVGDKAAKKSIDVYNKNELSLAQDPGFAEANRSFLTPLNMASYVDLSEFITQLKNQGALILAQADPVQKAQWEKVFSQMAGIKSLSTSSQLTPLIRIDSDLMFDPQELDPAYAAMYTCPGTQNKTIDFTPQEVLGYYWNSCLGLEHYWREFRNELEGVDEGQDKLAEMETGIGLSVENDILPAFGDEMGGYVQDIQVGGLFPIPKILLFLEVGQRAKIDALLSKLQQQPMAMLQEEDYMGTKIKYLGIPLGDDVQPGYAIFNNYLLIATSRSLIRQSIDVSGNPSAALQSSPDFREINKGLTDPNRLVQFIKIAAIIEKTKKIVDWSNEWMNTQDRKAEAFKSGSMKPLEEVEKQIAAMESELGAIRDEIVVIEDEIWNMDTKGEDASGKKQELADLQSRMKTVESDMETEYERAEQLASVVEDIDDQGLDPETRRFFINEVIFPILDSLKSIKTCGMRSTVRGHAIESTLLLKVAE